MKPNINTCHKTAEILLNLGTRISTHQTNDKYPPGVQGDCSESINKLLLPKCKDIRFHKDCIFKQR